jgi:hypothetical protein
VESLSTAISSQMGHCALCSSLSLYHLSYPAKMDNSFKGTERIGFIPESEYTGKEWLECYRTLSGFGGPKLKDSELLPLLANTVDYSWMRLGMYFLEMISLRLTHCLAGRVIDRAGISPNIGSTAEPADINDDLSDTDSDDSEGHSFVRQLFIHHPIIEGMSSRNHYWVGHYVEYECWIFTKLKPDLPFEPFCTIESFDEIWKSEKDKEGQVGGHFKADAISLTLPLARLPSEANPKG